MADNDIAPLAIQFEDADLDIAIFPCFEIVHWPQLDLRCRQKRSYANIHYQSAFDALHRFARDVRVFAVRFFDVLPDSATMCTHM